MVGFQVRGFFVWQEGFQRFGRGWFYFIQCFFLVLLRFQRWQVYICFLVFQTSLVKWRILFFIFFFRLQFGICFEGELEVFFFFFQGFLFLDRGEQRSYLIEYCLFNSYINFLYVDMCFLFGFLVIFEYQRVSIRVIQKISRDFRLSQVVKNRWMIGCVDYGVMRLGV